MSTPPTLVAAAVVILATSALSPARAQTADDDAVDRVLRASAMAPDARNVDVSQCAWLPGTRAPGRTASSLMDSSRKGSEEPSAALFPNLWKLYHALGETYAAAGNTKLAIRCFEKSVTLNPEDETGQAALSRLLNSDAVGRSSPHPKL